MTDDPRHDRPTDRSQTEPACERTTGLLEELAAQLAGETAEPPEADDSGIDRHLGSCPRCRREAAALRETWSRLGALELDASEVPTAELRRGFDAMLAGYRAGRGEGPDAADADGAAESPPRRDPAAAEAKRTALGRILPLSRRQRPERASTSGRLPSGAPRLAAAAAALVAALALGAVGGWWLGGAGEDGTGELDGLRAEVRALHELVALSLLEQPAATDRLRGVSFGARMDRLERPVVAALVERVERDPSANVRLAAVEALAGAASDPRVRDGLIAALGTEESPIVQIALADLLLERDGRPAREAVARLLDDPDLHPDVRRHLAERLGRSI